MRYCMEPLLKELELLQSGYVFMWHELLQREVRIFCRLAYTIGDSLASNDINGFMQPMCNFPCRLCTLPRQMFHMQEHVVDHFANDNPFPLRDEDVMTDIIIQSFEAMAANGPSQGQQTLQQQGLSNSPWRHLLRERLEYNPCTQSPIDVMHLEILNLWKFHVKRCLWPTLQEAQKQLINSRIVEARPIFGVNSLKKGVASFTMWNAHEWIALSYFLLPACIGVIPGPCLHLLGRHSKLLRMLGETRWIEADLNIFSIQYPTFMRDLQDRYPDMNWNFPSFHAGMHWSYYIRRFGTPVHYSVMRWEAVHQFFKRRKEVVSGRSDMLLQFTDAYLRVAELMQYDTNDWSMIPPSLTEMKLSSPLRVYPDVHLLNFEIPLLLGRIYAVQVDQVSSRIETFESIVLNGDRFRVGQDIRVDVGIRTWWVARIEHIIRHQQYNVVMQRMVTFVHLVVLWYDCTDDKKTLLECVRPTQREPRDILNTEGLSIYRVTVHTMVADNRFLLMDPPSAHRDFLLTNE